MPRISPYQIELTEDERDRLEAIARSYASPYRDVMRAKKDRVIGRRRAAQRRDR